MPEEPVWLPVAEAARRLGVTPQAIRNRIGRGTLEVRTEIVGNRTRRLVGLPDTVASTVPRTVPETIPQTVPGPVPAPVDHRDDTVIAELRAHVQTLEAALAVERARVDRLMALTERLTAERAPLPRRPWQGLRSWWRRVWEGVG